MKNLRLHAIYLMIIGVLTFQLWSKTTTSNRAFEQVEKVLEKNLVFFKSTNQNLIDAVNKHIYQNYERNGEYKAKIHKLDELTKSKFKFIDKTILDIKQGNPISFEEVKKSISEFPELLHVLTRDRGDSLALVKLYNFNELINNSTVKDVFRNRPLLYLFLLKNQMSCDEYIYYNYVFDKTTPIYMGYHQFFRLAVSPKKAALIEGEKFEADLYLASYSSNPGTGLVIQVNNQVLAIKEGVAHFKKSNNTIGLNKIKAQARITNPVTGEVKTINTEYEYQVLPKCSRDCQ